MSDFSLLSPLMKLALFITLASPALAEPPIRILRIVTAEQDASVPPAFFNQLSIGINKSIPAPKQLAHTLESHLAKPATEAELGLLADLVVDHLKQHHWPVSLVTVWDEDDGLAQGRVTLQVQQGKVGDIAIIGGSKGRQRQVAEQLRDLANTPLDGLRLQRRLDALAFSPWLACTPQAVPGSSLDTANLVLTLHEESPFHAFASYENNGIAPLGENRYTIGIEWLNAFALGQDLVLAATIADDPHTLTELAGSWRIPLPWHHELRLSGYYDESNSIANVLGIPLAFGGVSWEASARYVIPWRLSDHWRSEWSLGFDYKQFNTDFTFGGTAVLGDTTGVGSLVLGNQWFYDTTQNHARLALEASHGEPGWARGQDEDQFGELVPGANPRFTILRADAYYQHDFQNQMQAAFRIGGQWSDGLLLPSEELGLASINTVRGYPERSIRASRGAWTSFEVRTKPWQLLHSNLKLRALAFTDAGYSADDHTPTDFIASAGLGLRAELTQHLQLRCDLAFPLVDGDGARVHIAAVLRF